MPIIATCSDVSDRLPELKEPVDVIVLCGSFCPIFDKNLLSWNITNQVDYIEFKLNPWLDALPAPCKIIVGGRNDHIAEFYGHNLSYYLHAEYVQDDTINCKGMHVYGTPWIPPHMKSPDRADAFFSAKASKYIKAIERIPSFVDILVSNTYPREGESADLELPGSCLGHRLGRTGRRGFWKRIRWELKARGALAPGVFLLKFRQKLFA